MTSNYVLLSFGAHDLDDHIKKGGGGGGGCCSLHPSVSSDHFRLSYSLAVNIARIRYHEGHREL